MGQATLVARLAGRDLRRRPTEAVLLLVAIVAATTTLTLGLIVRELVSNPFQSTREATAGPDVVAMIAPPPGETPGQQPSEPTDRAALESLAREEGVVGYSGPFPVAGAKLEANGETMDVQALGRDPSPTSVDQPEVTEGRWVEEGGVVVEAAFAHAKDLSVGDEVTLNGQPFDVVGIAVTAASSPYPGTTCYLACVSGALPDELSALPAWVLRQPGLVWVTRSETSSLTAAPDSMPFVLNLQLEDPARATEFVAAHFPASSDAPVLLSWEDILMESSALVIDAQKVFLIGSGLLIVMAMATVAVVVVGRMAEQGRRVGMLKVVGGTPRLVAAVLLAEYVTIALAAAAVGLGLGWLAAPLISEPSVGLLGASAASVSLWTAAVVIGMALAIALIATSIPTLRAARTSTMVTIADTAHLPRRSNRLIAISTRLPVPLLLALRTLGRRPRRVVFSILGIAVTVSGVVTVVAGMPQLDEQIAAGGSETSSVERLLPVLMVILAMLIVLATVNAVFITRATVLDNRHASAVSRALGATPQQVSSGLSMAQILPALAGAILGVPGGIGLLYGVDDEVPFLPPFWHFAVVVLLAVSVIAVLTFVPARVGGRRPVARALQSE